MKEETKLVLKILENKATEIALNYAKEQKILKGNYPSFEKILKIKQKIFKLLLIDLNMELKKLLGNEDLKISYFEKLKGDTSWITLLN